jgi:hypothetical protein
MQEMRSPTQEAAEDIFFGQAAIIWARWFVILAGTILALWSATEVGQLIVSILMVVALMAINFFVHGRYLLERPVNTVLLAALSFMDLIIITLIILAWRGQVGLASPFFVFYYPVVLAVSFVFPPRLSSVYLIVTLALFAGAVLVSDPRILASSVDLEVMATRVITLAATGLLGMYYWRIQRQRRRKVSGLSPSVSDS